MKMGVRPGAGGLVGSKVGGRGWFGVNARNGGPGVGWGSGWL